MTVLHNSFATIVSWYIPLCKTSCWWFLSNFLNFLPGKYDISVTKITHSADDMAKRAPLDALVGTEMVSTVISDWSIHKRGWFKESWRVKETS